jgi:hypothetical protein
VKLAAPIVKATTLYRRLRQVRRSIRLGGLSRWRNRYSRRRLAELGRAPTQPVIGSFEGKSRGVIGCPAAAGHCRQRAGAARA